MKTVTTNNGKNCSHDVDSYCVHKKSINTIEKSSMWAIYSTHHVHVYELIYSHLLTEYENRTHRRTHDETQIASFIYFAWIYLRLYAFFHFPTIPSLTQSATNQQWFTTTRHKTQCNENSNEFVAHQSVDNSPLFD